MNSRTSYRNGSTPTVLLVHGAFADVSSWAGVIAELQAVGIPVTAVANPLRGLAVDATYVASIAAEIDGPVLLVGHSYGGVVINGASAQVGNIAGLVYVAAFALDEGRPRWTSTASSPTAFSDRRCVRPPSATARASRVWICI